MTIAEGVAESPGAAPCPVDPGRDRRRRRDRSLRRAGQRSAPGPARARAPRGGRVSAGSRADLHGEPDPPGRRPRDPGPTPGRAGPGRSLPTRAGRAGGPGTDRRPGCGRSLDAAGDPQRAGRIVPGVHPAVRPDQALRGPNRNCWPRPPRSSGSAGARPELAALAGHDRRPGRSARSGSVARRHDPARGTGRRPGAVRAAASCPDRRARRPS